MIAFEAVPKAIWYAAVAVAMGTLTARSLLAAPGFSPGWRHDAAMRLASLARATGVVALIAMALRLVGHSVAVFGAADALLLDNLRVVALQSRWGASWRLQAATAVLLTVTGFVLSRGAGRRWAAFAFATMLAVLAGPLVGHAAGSLVRHTLHAAHVAASGAWLGTLVVILALQLRTELDGDLARHQQDVRLLVQRFSPVALTAAGLVFVSGTIAAVLYVGTLAQLVDTDYGRVLLLKLAAVAGVLACGALNWRRSRAGAPPSVRLILLECTMAAVTLAVTSVLTETAHP